MSLIPIGENPIAILLKCVLVVQLAETFDLSSKQFGFDSQQEYQMEFIEPMHSKRNMINILIKPA